jgi:hypothetical protein
VLGVGIAAPDRLDGIQAAVLPLLGRHDTELALEPAPALREAERVLEVWIAAVVVELVLGHADQFLDGLHERRPGAADNGIWPLPLKPHQAVLAELEDGRPVDLAERLVA